MLFSLGSWQIYRLQWKNAILSKISKSYIKTPEEFNNNSKLYSKVKIKGKIINQPLFVYSLSSGGKYGYDVYVPVETKNYTILSKAGWVSKKFKLNQQELNSDITFDAILLKPKRKNIFTPENSIELIFFLDLELLQLNYTKKLYPLIAENNSDLLKQYNLRKPEKIKLPNNHLQYALTWYSLCFVIIVAFLIYKRKI